MGHPEQWLTPAGIERRPAFYAAGSGGWRDWWTLLHPPYTAWHLAYVVIGASLAPRSTVPPPATLLAFFFAVGIAAHALDQLHGRPLGTRIPTPVLIAVTVAGLVGAVVLGVVGLSRVGWPDPLHGARARSRRRLQLGAFRGLFHSDFGFAAGRGSFPVLVGYVAQTGRSLWPGDRAGAAFARRPPSAG